MSDELMTPAQVAEKFCVAPKTVTRWAKEGRLEYVRTLGGHRRFRRTEVEKLSTASRGEDNWEDR